MASLPAAFSYHAFLSHKYKAPEVNLHFFDLFSTVGEVQFKVDLGTSRISMTRLHRMVRDADAFIGIYPLLGSVASRPTSQELKAASGYFRLELDIAVRSGKPAIVFYDDRFRSVLRVPEGMFQYGYDPQEIAGQGGTPTRGRQLTAIKQFSEVVMARMAYDAISATTQLSRYDTVGILLPDGKDVAAAYDAKVIKDLVDLIQGLGYECKILPRVIDANFYNTLHRLDWVVVDVGSGHGLLPIVAFLHGQCTPLLLLKHVEPGASSQSDLEQCLFGAVDVGYTEDTLTWEDPDALLSGVRERLATIDAEITRVSTAEEARQYFNGASRRKEHVFLSYAGEDRSSVSRVKVELGKRFQKVFDYKEPGSIAAGSEWIRDLFASLSQSAIGIICLSKNYLASGNCQHEAVELIAQRDQGKTSVFVVNLDGVDPPKFMQYLQYLVPDEHDDGAGLIEAVLREIGPA